ncbi:MAG: type II secretion system minor pseudopilin GspI [Gammaproteobacteria bacterium]|nr:type II secretion system minor pseudopilin GspI [Gammaproteobacteria bacterium]
MHKPLTTASGFTLVEILVALVILATSFMALIEIAGSHTSNLTYLRDKTFAHWVAMNKIAEARISKTFPELGNSDGTMKMGKQEWVWESSVYETKINAVRRIEISIKRDKTDNTALVKRVGFIQKKGKGERDEGEGIWGEEEGGRGKGKVVRKKEEG